MARLLLTMFSAFLSALTLTSCLSAPAARADAPVTAARVERVAPEAGISSDPALLLGEFPLAKNRPVLDGDTIRVEGLDASMRLLGIDTEETFKRDSEREAFARGWDSYLKEMRGTKKRPVKMATPAGTAGDEFAKSFFAGVETVRLERDHPGEIRDFYNRYLAYVFAFKDGQWVNYNVESVRAGWSPYFTKYGRSRRFHEAFLQAQAEAREARRGIWGDEVLHYPDYDERLEWWNAREAGVTAFEEASKGRDDHVSLTRADSLEVLAARVGKPVSLLGLVGEVKAPTSEKAPWVVRLSKDRFKSFQVVFFDKAVLDATRIAGQVGEYVVVSGVVTEYRGTPQLVVKDPAQVRAFVEPVFE